MESFDFGLGVNPRLKEYYDACLPLYREMYKHRLKIQLHFCA